MAYLAVLTPIPKFVKSLLQPMDSMAPWPRKRSRESSSRQRTARVRELPASTAAAICGLFAIASRLHGGDTVIQSQVQNGGIGLLILIEAVLPPANQHSMSKFFDLNMLVMTGGRERTTSEFKALFEAAGFRLTRVVPTDSEFSLIEGVPV